MREYVNDLKWMTLENKWLDSQPKSFCVADVAELRNESQKATPIAFDNTKILVNKYTRSPDTRVRTTFR